MVLLTICDMEKNMKPVIASMFAVGMMIGGGVMAADMPELAKKNACVSCHEIDKKRLARLGWKFPKSIRAMPLQRPN